MDFGGQRKMNKFKVYRHFKGRCYLKIGEAMHTETGETLVLYTTFLNQEEIYARPKSMFYGHVVKDDYTGPRFISIEDLDMETI